MNLFELVSRLAKPHDHDDDLSHIACSCSPNVNLCGLRQEFHGFCDGPLPPNACVVCVDLDDLPCERCGQ